MDRNWHADLEHWLAPFSATLRHKTRARMCPAYVAGLIGPGDRKSIQPMAARTDTVSYDQLHHLIGSGVWDAAPLEAVLVAEADKLVGGDNSWLIVSARLAPLYLVGVDTAKNPPAVTEVWDGVGRQKGRPFGRLADWNSQPA